MKENYEFYLVVIETCHPLSRKRVCPPPPGTNRERHTRLQIRGWGSPNSDDWSKSSALVSTLWSKPCNAA